MLPMEVRNARLTRARFAAARLAIVCLLLLASPAAAQFDRATISGVVKDQSGAIVPGVTVTAKSLQTQELQTAVSDASGYFTMTTLRPGRYDVSAELDGFKKASRTGVQLDAWRRHQPGVHAGGGQHLRNRHGRGADHAHPDGRGHPEDGRGQGHRVALVLGPQPDWRPRAETGRRRAATSTTRVSRSFSNGGFNINGSRADENTITVDGAIAIRTRSAGTIIGVQNVDAIQEVQVLTANYLPEYGRASGGQIRFITKSGSSRYSGSASFFYRDDKLQANTWSRNRSPNAIENGGPSPFDYKQYGCSVGGPIPGEWFKNKLFFFAAQEWVDFFAVATNPPPSRPRRCATATSANCSARTRSTARPQIIRDPLTGLPFPGNIIPANRLSPNGIALMKLYPLPTPGFQSGSENLIHEQRQPAGTSGRTTSGSTTDWATTTRSPGATRSRTTWPSTPSAGRSPSRAPTGTAPTRR